MFNLAQIYFLQIVLHRLSHHLIHASRELEFIGCANLRLQLFTPHHHQIKKLGPFAVAKVHSVGPSYWKTTPQTGMSKLNSVEESSGAAV